MPPKHKFTREQMLSAALILLEEGGMENLSVRNLGKKLGVSSRPLYSLFADLDDLKAELARRVSVLLHDYLRKDNGPRDPFLNMGAGYIRFAMEHPGLYRILHTRDVMKLMEESSNGLSSQLVGEIKQNNEYGIFTPAEIGELMNRMTIFTHGLADLLARGVLPEMTEQEIITVLKETGQALINHKIKTKEGARECT